MKQTKTAPIAIIGGTGFVGRYIVAELARRGHRLRLLVRRPDRAKFLLPLGTPGQIALVAGRASDTDSLRRCIAGCQGVINAVGILAETGKQRFTALHADLPETLGRLTDEVAQKDARLIHLSALGADRQSASRYARSKAEGEARLLAVLPKATILRPSLVFGTEDQFFNRFARMALWSPVLPLIAGGKTKFQPVHVVNVAEAVVAALNTPQSKGKTYAIAGGRVYSFAELLRYMLVIIRRRRQLLSLPAWAMVLPSMLMEWMPNPMLTRDQLRLLKTDAIIKGKAGKTLTLADLGITPTPLELIVPEYLTRFSPGGGMATLTNRQ